MIKEIINYLFGDRNRESRLYRTEIAEQMLQEGASAEQIRTKLGIDKVDDIEPVWY